jgi:hypothetical protein
MLSKTHIIRSPQGGFFLGVPLLQKILLEKHHSSSNKVRLCVLNLFSRQKKAPKKDFHFHP